MKRRISFFVIITFFFVSFGMFLFLDKGDLTKFVVLVKGEEEIQTIEEKVAEEEEEQPQEVDPSEEEPTPEITPLEEEESKDTTETIDEEKKLFSETPEKEVSELITEEETEQEAKEEEILNKNSMSPSLRGGTPTFVIEFSVLNRNVGTMSLEEGLNQANITFLENGVSVELDFVLQEDKYVSSVPVSVGPEYEFGSIAKISGYNNILNCYDDSMRLIDYPIVFQETSNFKCVIRYEDWLYNLDVWKIIIDEDGNEYRNNDREVFTAKLSNPFNNKVLTDTMVMITEDDSYFKWATFSNLGQPGEFVLTEEPKDGYVFLGCTEAEPMGIYVKSSKHISSLPPLFKKMAFKLDDLGWNRYYYSVCFNQIILNSYLKVVKSNDSVKDGIQPSSDVKFTLTVTAPSDGKEGNFISKDVIVYDKVSQGFTYKSGSWRVFSSRRGQLSVPEPVYNETDWAQWRIGDMVEGEIVTLELITHASADLKPGVYTDVAYVKGVSITGTEVLGNISTGSDSEFVGTEVKILGALVATESTLPKTGANTYITIVGLLLTAFGIGVLIKNQKHYST